MYKRPHLREFLAKISQIGTVSVFTQNVRSYADPIIDRLDPDKKIFKHRFYSEHCVSNGDGEIIKDMSVLEEFKEPEDADGQPAAENRSSSWSSAFSKLFSPNAFVAAQTTGGVLAPSIQMSRTLMK